MKHLVFGWIDYTLFGSLLGISLLIGIYFGFFSKQDSAEEYLYGGKKMKYFPVGFSILASLLSGITYIGIPTEVYLHGGQYIVSMFSVVATCMTIAYAIIPLFYELQLSSVYEYLELRFSRFTRTFASVLYTMSLMMYIPIVIYVPALAFSQVTGYSVHAITPIFSFVCIFYTTIGGVKAVVWTDTVQFFFTVGGLITVLSLGFASVGGVSQVFKVADDGGRLDIFNFDPSPLSRTTFWGMTIGIYIADLGRVGMGQKFIQRFLTIEKRFDIHKAIFIMTFGWILLQSSCVIVGLLMYTKYAGCDPFKAQLVHRSDQTLPFFVMDIAGHISGFPGVFLAGLVSSALSTMSASLNTLSGTIYDNFIDSHIEDNFNKDAKAARIMKVISFLIGLVTIGEIFVIERLGTIFEMAFSISSAVDGPLFGLFILGMFVPKVGKRGANVGAITAMLLMLWIVGGAQWHILHKNIRFEELPTSIEKCDPSMVNLTTDISVSVPTPDLEGVKEEPFILFRISFLFLVIVGSSLTVTIGLIISTITGENNIKVDPRYVSPLIRRFLPKSEYKEVALNDKITRNENKT